MGLLVIGERINCTRKRIGEAAARRDEAFIRQEALKQVRAGAHVVDVNGGLPGMEEDLLPWLVEVVQQAVDVPLCLDSPSPGALSRALPLCRHRPIVNSVSLEPGRIEGILPLVTEHKARIVALCIGADGMPQGVDDRVAFADALVGRLTAAGVDPADVFVDPCVFPIGTGHSQGAFFLEALSAVKAHWPEVHAIAGVSYVSFGLPGRKLLNEIFLVAAMARGLDSAIIDPCDDKTMAAVAASEAVLGQDEYCARFLRAFRDGRLGASPVAQPTA